MLASVPPVPARPKTVASIGRLRPDAAPLATTAAPFGPTPAPGPASAALSLAGARARGLPGTMDNARNE